MTNRCFLAWGFCCALPGLSVAQTPAAPSPLRVGAEVSYSLQSYLNGTVFTPALQLGKGRHELLAGPRLEFGQAQPAVYLQGAQLTYRVYAGRNEQSRLRFFFFDDLAYSRNQVQGSTQTWAAGSLYDSRYQRTERFVANNVGYGFRLALTPHLALTHCGGLGAGFFSEQYRLTVPDRPTSSYARQEGLLGTNPELTYLMKIGLGYAF